MVLTEIIDPCKEMDKALREELGDDYRTNREKFPLTKEGLSMIASASCESYFGYDALVQEYCADVKHFEDQIGVVKRVLIKLIRLCVRSGVSWMMKVRKRERVSRQMVNVQKRS